MNLFDLGAVLLLALAAVLGFRSGALPQVGGLLGAAIGGSIAILGLPYGEPLLDQLDPPARAIVVLGTLLGAIGLGEALGSTAGRAVGRRLGPGLFGALDRVAGSIVGAAQAVLIIWLAGSLLAIGPVPRLASVAQTSTAVRVLNTVLPSPTALAADLGQLLNASGLPDVFVGLEPLPAPPVDRPDDPTARAIAAAAEASTVKVTAGACGNVSTGTGFAVADGYVVTNAHVIAGARVTRVSVTDRLLDATPVYFNPSLDVAVLHVPDLDARPLRFAVRDPDRGTTAAALGYPEGGALTIIPAAIAGRYEATGRDIYGQGLVARQILELRASIERGDSGGPLVLADGTVGGVIFAEARTDEDVGYALTARSVAIVAGPAIGRTGAVATGSCLE
jgi:S1-C subfamily serine protease